MSTAEASAGEARVDPLSSWLDLDQEPKKGDEAAPSGERERDGQQQSVAAAERDFRSLRVVFLGCLAVSQLTWMGALAYLGLLLLF